MDGGIDLILRERFGMQIEDRVQEAIGRLGGKLPVGLALIVETADDEVPYLIVAPTMEVPMNVAGTNHAYLSMRAVLTTAVKFAGRDPGMLQSIAIPGLCTGIGGMDPRVAAEQMRRAYADVVGE
jgi:O-acetyl-ADP-ribose deacetylase (regulator of RNase III)